MREHNKNKVFIIGLDGATLDLIHPWVNKGRLPGFARLIERGAHGRLESTPNQRSASAWTSLLTGKNPGKHGIYEFYEYVQGTYDIRFLNGSDGDSDSLWKILSRNGKKVIVVNVPMTYPAEEVNGILIAGLDSPGADSEGFMFPSDIKKELHGKFGNYIIEPGITGFIVGGKIDEALKTLNQELEQKFEIAKHLMNTKPWDFFMVVFRSLDAAQHCFWKYTDPVHPQYTEEGNRKYGDAIYNVYKKLDMFIEEYMDKIDDNTTLMIVSDHGFGRKHSAAQALNNWLESKGYLVFKDPETSSSFGVYRKLQTKILAGLYSKVVGKTSRKIKERLVKLFPGLRNMVQSRLIFADIDWKKTKAYSDTLFPNIIINLKGREPLGIVEAHEYRDLIEKIKTDIKGCRNSETNECIVEDVFERSEIYWGKHLDKAPDILIRWREDILINTINIDKKQGNSAAESHSYPLIPGEDARIISGDHHLNGVLFLKGKDIKQNHILEGSKIIDIASTVLYQLGCKIPDDIDGEVLKGAYNKDYFNATPPGIEKTGAKKEDRPKASFKYSEEDSEAVAARLRNLGYLE